MTDTIELPIDKKVLDEPYRKAVPEKYRYPTSNTPVFENVVVTRRYNVWDGVLSGICKIDGKDYWFEDVIESIWRHYDVMETYEVQGKRRYYQKCDRLWRIFAVYHIQEDDIENSAKGHCPIGVFWDYEMKLEGE